MASASSAGDIALWNLEERRLVHLINEAHDGEIHTCFFYHGMSILLSAGSDNSIKQWIFDNLDGSPRLLKLRSGHKKPPNKLMFYGDSGHDIISTGQDRTLRYTSVIRDARNVEISQGQLEHKSKKMNIDIDTLRIPEILQFYASKLYLM